jgi:demethylmenaquinone methyltransferase/2-methoxy-6-polyprenyl-1,4-benzoquinol methylase
MNSLGQPRGPLRGTRPAGSGDEREAAARVREMFSRIASHYDFLNHLLSLSFDRGWRRRAARRFSHILARPDARVLDLCCGTGDLTLALAKLARHAGQGLRLSEGGGARVWGSDFAHPMLVRAQEKSAVPLGKTRAWAAEPGGARWPLTAYVEADALSLPFPDASFELVTMAFGFRNLANYESGLREIYRLLRPGGEAGILEFAQARGRWFAPIYRFYFRRILPRIGGAISGDTSTYAYLPSSVLAFPSPEELQGLMQHTGFTAARFELWTAGIVALHWARKG